MTYIELKQINKIYKDQIENHALKDISFSIPKGHLTVILGPSGAGKTTLLNILGGMDFPSSGDIIIDDKNISKLSSKELTKYRKDDVGFVFQFYNLMPNLTALENVELACEVKKDSLNPKEILSYVGLEDRISSFPAKLSGGEQQRVSIARAIAKNPKILLCDEPTGALDSQTGKNILSLLKNISYQGKTNVIIVTHNSFLKDIADEVIYIKNGQIDKIIQNEKPKNIDEIEW